MRLLLILLLGWPMLVQAAEPVRVVGSSTVFPFATVVAESLARDYGLPAPIIEATGTGAGLAAFCRGAGQPLVAMASRRIKPSETALCAQHGITDIREVAIGFDGIALASNSDAAPLDLTLAQLWLALARQVPVAGKLVSNPYRSWHEIDARLPVRPIRIFGPPPTSGTRDAFVELVMEKGCSEFAAINQLPEADRKQACAALREDGAFIEAGENDNLLVQRLLADPDSMAIFGYSFLAANRDRLHGARLNGVADDPDNIRSGAYPAARSLYLYIKPESFAGLRDFVASFVADEAAGMAGYLLTKGLIPLPDAQRLQQQAVAAALPDG